MSMTYKYTMIPNIEETINHQHQRNVVVAESWKGKLENSPSEDRYVNLIGSAAALMA